MLVMPITFEEMSPAWLTQALTSTGVLSGAALVAVTSEILGVGRGFTGQVARLRVEYNAAADGAPRSLIAKLPAADPSVRAALNALHLYERELRFYETVGQRAAIPVPRRLYSAADAAAGNCVLLLEDLAPARPGDAVAGCSPNEAEMVIRQLAKFHAAWWESPRFGELEWLWPYDAAAEASQAHYRRSWSLLQAKFGDRLPEPLRAVGAAFGRRAAATFRRLCRSPQTIVHGDCRLDNLLFGTVEGQAPVTFIDWQLTARGPGMLDVAYFLSSSTGVEHRRSHEAALLRLYHASLVEQGVRGYEFEQCWEDYRLGAAHSLLVAVNALALLDFSSKRAQFLAAAMLGQLNAFLADHNFGALL